jgi:hypothetical protein
VTTRAAVYRIDIGFDGDVVKGDLPAWQKTGAPSFSHHGLDRESSALHLVELAPLFGRRSARLLGLLALLFDLELFEAGGSINLGRFEAGPIERNNLKHWPEPS